MKYLVIVVTIAIAVVLAVVLVDFYRWVDTPLNKPDAKSNPISAAPLNQMVPMPD